MAEVAVVESLSSSTENTISSSQTARDEDEKYLYGEESTETKTETQTSDQNQDSQETTTTNEQKSEEDEDGEFEESDDDDDDNIQVHIGEVNTANANAYGTPVNWKKENQTAASKSAILPTQGQKKIDVNTVGLINGQPIYEFDLDNELDEKPWRKPGADISDYFNYGFTQDTWKQYCEKQRRMRLESNRGPYTVTATNPVSTTAQVEIEVLPDGRTRVKAGPPPDRKVEGSIHVLGSDADARRKQKEEELLALALGQTRVMAPTTFPGQRPLYTALPGGAVMYNPITGQQILQPPNSSQGETSSAADTTHTSSQAQQIQSLGAPTMINSVLPGGIQYLQPGQTIGGMQPIAPGGAPLFQPPHGIGMEFPPQDPFLHPGMPPGFNAPYGHSDDDYDSDSENRRHRSRRDTSSRHRRHRDRDRDGSRSDRDRDRDRSRRDRDRSESRSRREHSKSSSDRKKHSSRSSSSIKVEDDESGDRKSRSSRRSAKPVKEETDVQQKVDEAPEVKQEPVGD